ncbi:thiolase family protein [Xanthobacter autotrophicus]|uniref:thiolase family protein n=1 Tax=Xanthobacter autotrophicus TaxID=280 RepID=UPI0024A6EA13|nr:thiolase family protein [Xanthobacter autotrophicus]MDI4657021.1 thiolase family protein [Xanthobacter autotrophicus]
MIGVALLGAKRTAVVPRSGAFRHMEPFALAAALIGPLLAEAGLAPDAVDEVILGNALSGGGNVARVAALAAGLPQHIPALTLDTQCCSGLDAIRMGAARIAAGEARYVLAGGVESFSRAPLRAHRPRRKEDAPLFYRQPAFTPWPEREPDLAVAAAALARAEGITRQAQEAFAMESHRRALAAAPPEGEIVPVNGIVMDPFARALSPALLARLPVIAGDAADGITAATTAVEADAAALVLLGPCGEGQHGEGRVQVLGALARGGDPLMPALAPVAAVEALCARLGLDARQIEHVELMEAYAAQALAGIGRLGLDPARVNAQGGALARGHPIGASGAVLAVRAFHRLRAAGGRALVAIAGAGGIASAMVVSRQDETLRPWQD